MARNIANSAGTNAQMDVATAAPFNSTFANGFTFACWAKRSGTASAGWDRLGSTEHVTATSEGFGLFVQGSGTVNAPSFSIRNGSTQYSASSSTILPLSSWVLVAGRFTPSTSVQVTMVTDAGVVTTTTNSTSIPATMNAAAFPLHVGVSSSGAAPSSAFYGIMAEVGVWNIPLTDAQLLQLAVSKYTATLVARSNLIGAWRLLGTNSPEPSNVGGESLTLTPGTGSSRGASAS